MAKIEQIEFIGICHWQQVVYLFHYGDVIGNLKLRLKRDAFQEKGYQLI